MPQDERATGEYVLPVRAKRSILLSLSATDRSSKVGVISAPGEPPSGLFKVDGMTNCRASGQRG
jgi:hypothetical protein